MPTAEIITIGTELLLGETVDTNTRYIARKLRDYGIDLYRTSTIGDNVDRIAEIIKEGLSRSDVIITTGGLGPTVDDPTREAVAKAFGVETVYKEELWEQIQERFNRYGRKPTENNKRQAYIPDGATAVENPVGTAPAFIMARDNHSVISLPGVPREMEHLMINDVLPYLSGYYDLSGVIKARVLHTAGIGESIIDERIEDLERLHNPTVGLAAHAGQVDVRITAKAEDDAQADILIHEVEERLRKRLGSWIYGADEETLEQVALNNLTNLGWKMVIVEAGLGGRLIQRLAKYEGPFLGGEVFKSQIPREETNNILATMMKTQDAQVGLSVIYIPGETKQTLDIHIQSPNEDRQTKHSYGGPPKLAPTWAVNLILDLIRKLS